MPTTTPPELGRTERLLLADALSTAAPGDVDPVRAVLEQLPPALLAAAIHRADLVAVIAEDIQQQRAAAQDRHPAGRDRVADAFRAEVLRQGLTECEIDGIRWEYRLGSWRRARVFHCSPRNCNNPDHYAGR
ncbi:hypothetical protein GCM10018962_77470 [Dactylosporangium matsuzakiense]|uniref:hypothetical protein n=1 Tax=Dactylosporangium matsuzakiense TaxID=53360 RepID=UPI0031EF12A9